MWNKYIKFTDAHPFLSGFMVGTVYYLIVGQLTDNLLLYLGGLVIMTVVHVLAISNAKETK